MNPKILRIALKSQKLYNNFVNKEEMAKKNQNK